MLAVAMGFHKSVQCGGAQENASREACFMASATRPAISLALSESRGLCSTIKKELWFSSRMVRGSKGGEGFPHYQLDRAAI
jgi:hypothetical protein